MFKNRNEAGSLLARELEQKGYGGEDTIVLAIPRGGVVVGKVVADYLKAPLDVVIVKKLGVPHQPELALGAVGPEGVLEINWDLAERLKIDESYIQNQVRKLQKEVNERGQKFRSGKQQLNIKDMVVIVVDDGIATGATVESACLYLRKKNTRKLVVAVPVGPTTAREELVSLADEVLILLTPPDFSAVGQFYRNFPQITDEEVIKLLNQ